MMHGFFCHHKTIGYIEIIYLTTTSLHKTTNHEKINRTQSGSRFLYYQYSMGPDYRDFRKSR